LHKLIGKIDELNINVEKLPDKNDIEKMEREKRKKVPLMYLFIFLMFMGGGYYLLNRKVSQPVPMQMQPTF